MGKRGWQEESYGAHRAEPRVKIRDPPHIRAIQDRTIGLLFEGANRKDMDVECRRNQISKDVSSKDNRNSKNMKQMCIGKDGALVFSGVIDIADCNECGICSNPIDDITISCSYCEVKQCPPCARTCTICALPTCHNCSITSYCDHIGTLCLTCCR